MKKTKIVQLVCKEDFDCPDDVGVGCIITGCPSVRYETVE